MTADVESFVSYREPAWHQLGTVWQEKFTLQEGMDEAKLSGWNVRLESIPDAFPDYNFYQHRNIVIRDNPFGNGIDVLGDVGGRFTVLQNEELFAFADNLLHGLGTWETLGSLQGGVKVFGCLTMDLDEIVLDPQGAHDRVRQYLMATQAHDGSGAIVFGVTPVRVVCANTLAIALSGLKTRYSIKHTPGQKAKREDAQKILGISLRYHDKFEEEARAMFETACTAQQFDDLIKEVYPEPEVDAPKGAHTKWENKRTQLTEIWHGPTNTTIRDTAWGAFNAFTERLDWYRTPRKGDSENVLAAASGFDDVIAAEKNKIYWAVQDTLVNA